MSAVVHWMVLSVTVAGVCHGSATEAEMRGLNELLRSNPN